MNRRRGEVDGISRRHRRQNRALNQFIGQIGDMLADVEQREAGQKFQALLGHDRISVRSLFEDDLRRVEVVRRTMKIPPLAGEFLTRELDNVSRWSCDVIARNRGFDEYGVWHLFNLATRRFGSTRVLGLMTQKFSDGSHRTL